MSAAATAGMVALRRRGSTGLRVAAAEPINDLLEEPDVARALAAAHAEAVSLDLTTLNHSIVFERDEHDVVVASSESFRTSIGGGALALTGERVVFTSPVVLHARTSTLATLDASGVTSLEGGVRVVDTVNLLRSGIPFGLPHPGKHDPAFLFGGLTLAALDGDGDTARRVLRPRVIQTEGFDAFVASDPLARGLRIGGEYELPRYAVADSARWSQLQSSRPDAVPVTVYLKPTVYLRWTALAFSSAAAALGIVLSSAEVQRIGRLRHGLRGPERQSGVGEAFSAAARLPPAPEATLPLPDREAMHSLAAALSFRLS